MKLSSLNWIDGIPLSCKCPEMISCWKDAVLAICGWSNKSFEKSLKMAQSIEPEFIMFKLLSSLDSTIKLEKLLNFTKTEYEKKHIMAAIHMSKSHFRTASQIYEEILLDYPTDLLALKICSDIYLTIGDFTQLRDSPARVLEIWKDNYSSFPEYGSLLGMYAFGLEENNQYEKSEKIGRRAIELVPTDSWCVHAVTHVLEMEGRQIEGIEFLKSTEKNWKDSHSYNRHNYWHSALFHTDLGQYDDALRIFDLHLSGKTDKYLDLIDASSLLFRIGIDIDVTERWSDIMEFWKSKENIRMNAFTDLHMIMNALGCKDLILAENIFQSMKDYTKQIDTLNDQLDVYKSVGIPFAEALIHWNKKDYEKAISNFWPVRCNISSLGGSRAQRDVFEIFCVQSSLYNPKISNSILSERVQLKPNSPSTWKWFSQTLDLLEEKERSKVAYSNYKKLVQIL